MADLPYKDLGSVLDVADVPNPGLSLDNYGPKLYEDPPVKYEVCTTCGFVYSRRDMIRFKRQWYCKPQACSDDIPGMRLDENEEAYFKNKGLANRFWKGSGGRRI